MEQNCLNTDFEKFREVFLKSESTYINDLLKKKYYINLLRRTYNKPTEVLIKFATDIINSIELGQVAPKDLETYEGIVSVLLLCTYDSIREAIEKNLKKQKKDDNYTDLSL